MDLEGTIFLKNYRLDNGKVAPSAWTVIAEQLGPGCLAEEEETKERWNRGEYSGYVEWMRDTIRIHQKYGLKKHVYEEIINSVNFTPGVHEAVLEFQQHNTITAIITGGFKALADRAQKELKVDHALSACEYFFNDKTGIIDHFNLLPSDEEGKVDFMKLIAKEHGVNLEDCAFVGDGKNDVGLACAVGFSVAFNAQPELNEHVSFIVKQPKLQENFHAVAEAIRLSFPQRRRGFHRKMLLFTKKIMRNK
jgi:phosphoserine phosphatase